MDVTISFNGHLSSIHPLTYNMYRFIQSIFTLYVEENVYKSIQVKTQTPLLIENQQQLIGNYNPKEQTLTTLTGFIPKIVSTLKKYNNKFTFNYQLVDSYTKVELDKTEEIIISPFLYEHQRECVITCLQKKRGIIKLPTASGKAFIIAELCRIYSQYSTTPTNILITVPTITLLYQLKEEIVKLCKLGNYKELEVGLIGDGKLDISKQITIAIPNTLAIKVEEKDQAVLNYLASINILFNDEVHYCATPTFLSIVENITNRGIHLGYSATPNTNTGADALLEGMIGSLIFSKEEIDLINKSIIMSPLFEFYQTTSTYVTPSLLDRANAGYSHYIYNKLYDQIIIHNKNRNRLIVKLVKEYIGRREGPIAIIVNKVTDVIGKDSHATIMQELLLKEGIDLPILQGSLGKKKRTTILEQLADYSIDGAICGPKIFTAGVNIPSVNAMLLAGAGSTDSIFIQRVGRALRKSNYRPIIYDILDVQSYFKSQSRTRVNVAIDTYGRENVRLFSPSGEEMNLQHY